LTDIKTNSKLGDWSFSDEDDDETLEERETRSDERKRDMK